MALLIFIARVALGALFVVAGAFKAHDGIVTTAASVAAYRILPAFLVAPVGVILPYFEIGLGAYLIGGLFVRASGIVAAAQLAIFAAAVGSLVVRQIPASCGCFGSGDRTPPSWGHVAVDLALALVAVAIARYGPGRWSLDSRFGTGGASRALGEPRTR
ncbi:MAG: DoxX family protein [Candidatus Baltobacteraceae bacterium]